MADNIQVKIKVAGMMTLPRYGANAARNIIDGAFQAAGIPVYATTGVFWEQKMQAMLESLVENEVDVAIAVDSDTYCTEVDVRAILGNLMAMPHVDCLAAFEPAQLEDRPLASLKEAGEVDASDPFEVTTAHFGLTAIRLKGLRGMSRPWFHGQPNEAGEWKEGKIDPDIYFWNKWRKCGNSIWIDPRVRIGHGFEGVRYYDDTGAAQVGTAIDWRNQVR